MAMANSKKRPLGRPKARPSLDRASGHGIGDGMVLSHLPQLGGYFAAEAWHFAQVQRTETLEMGSGLVRCLTRLT
jgi:hypothetical protein